MADAATLAQITNTPPQEVVSRGKKSANSDPNCLSDKTLVTSGGSSDAAEGELGHKKNKNGGHFEKIIRRVSAEDGSKKVLKKKEDIPAGDEISIADLLTQAQRRVELAKLTSNQAQLHKLASAGIKNQAQQHKLAISSVKSQGEESKRLGFGEKGIGFESKTSKIDQFSIKNPQLKNLEQLQAGVKEKGDQLASSPPVLSDGKIALLAEKTISHNAQVAEKISDAVSKAGDFAKQSQLGKAVTISANGQEAAVMAANPAASSRFMSNQQPGQQLDRQAGSADSTGLADSADIGENGIGKIFAEREKAFDLASPADVFREVNAVSDVFQGSNVQDKSLSVASTAVSSAAGVLDDAADSIDRPAARQLINFLRTQSSKQDEDMVLHLDPPELGKIKMVLRAEGNNLRLVMEVDNSRTLEDIQRSAPALVQRLNDSGIDVKNMEFLSSDQSRDGQLASQGEDSSDGNFDSDGSSSDESSTATALDSDDISDDDIASDVAAGVGELADEESINVWI